MVFIGNIVNMKWVCIAGYNRKWFHEDSLLSWLLLWPEIQSMAARNLCWQHKSIDQGVLILLSFLISLFDPLRSIRENCKLKLQGTPVPILCFPLLCLTLKYDIPDWIMVKSKGIVQTEKNLLTEPYSSVVRSKSFRTFDEPWWTKIQF